MLDVIYLVIRNPGVLIILIVCFIVKIFPPKKINFWYGYRTKKSMKNIENWNRAQKYSTNLTIYILIVLLILQILIYMLFGSNVVTELIIVFLLIVGMLIMIYKTEKMLEEIV